MNKQIIIGKQGTQPFQISDPKVSRRHACLIIEDNNQLKLLDNCSTNGTFIYNGSTFVRIEANQPYPVTPDTMIQLGPDTRFHVKRLLPVAPKPAARHQPGNAAQGQPSASEKKIDIRHLRRISEKYTEKKMEIESKTGMITGLSSTMLLVSLLAGGASNFMTNSVDFGENKLLWQSGITVAIAGVLVIALLSFINIYKKRLLKQRNDNEHDYAVKYCCPNCKVSFRGKIYENILAERQCPKCKIKYYDSSEGK